MADQFTFLSSFALQIHPSNCEYGGEGNANIVIRFLKEKKVLRLVKNMSADLRNSPSALENSRRNGQRKVQVYRDYVKNVMQKLLGNCVSDPELVELSEKDVEMINSILEGKRPVKNQDHWLQETATIGILLPDFCDLPQELSRLCNNHQPVLAVEIKPKQGFISPFGQKLGEDSKQSVCRYCMKQSLKLKTNYVVKKSGYCPLDLFSGCPVRMSTALKALLKNPQNNMTIFKDQKIVFNEHKLKTIEDALSSIFESSHNESVEEQFLYLVVQALLLDYTDEFFQSFDVPHFCSTSSHCGNVPTVSCVNSGMCSHVLPRGCVLSRILQAQKLGESEAELVYPFVKEELLQSNLQLVDCYPKCSIPKHMGLREQHPSETSSEFQSRKIWEFLVSMTARDCSVMLALQKIEKSENVPPTCVIKDKVGNLFVASVAVVDLDPKSVHRVEGVFRLNQEIKEAHLQCT